MAALLTFVFTVASGLLLLGDYQAEQLIAATAFGVVAVGWSVLIRKVGERPIRFSAAHFAPWLRAIAQIPRDTVKVGTVLTRAALVGGSPGKAGGHPFRSGAVDDPRDRGRRATALLTGSLTPDQIIVDAAPGEAEAKVHRMTAGSPTGGRDWLV